MPSWMASARRGTFKVGDRVSFKSAAGDVAGIRWHERTGTVERVLRPFAVPDTRRYHGLRYFGSHRGRDHQSYVVKEDGPTLKHYWPVVSTMKLIEDHGSPTAVGEHGERQDG